MKREHLWPIGLTAILMLTVAGNLWVMRIANADPSFAIEPDYYARAVRWDSTLAQEGRNRALAWRLAPALGGFSRDGAELRVTLTDASGVAIRGATVNVSALFVGRASQVVETALVERDAGYAVTLPVHHAGAWELKFDVTRGDDRFTITHRLDASPAPGVRGT